MNRNSRLLTAMAAALLAPTAWAQSLPTIPPTLDATSATNDRAVQGASANHSFYLPGISKELMFVPAGRFTQDRDAGTARLVGRVVDEDDASKAFDVDVVFTGLTAIAPPNSPKEELNASAYAPAGGPIDTSTWYYYTSFSGTLIGADAFAGGEISIAPRGPVMQIGYGASGKNTLYGGSCWFTYEIEECPAGLNWADGVGDINVNFNGDCLCAHPSDADPAISLDLDTSALALAGALGCGNHWDLDGDAVLDVDAAAGTSRLLGALISRLDPNCRLEIDLQLTSRTLPGDPSYPPPGAPMLAETVASALSANGGPVDPAQWIHYQDVTGTLTGTNDLAGASISVAATAPAQVGVGAARNAALGARLALQLTVDAQPTSGPALANDAGTLWLDLVHCDHPVLMPRGSAPVPTLPTVTEKCFLIQGCSLDTVTELHFGSHVITSQDPCDFGAGYFEILDANSLCFYPPLCLDPATMAFAAIDGDGNSSDTAALALEEPAAPALACAADVPIGCSQSLYLWGGPGGPKAYCLFVSGSNLPSVLPGVLYLEIGNGFTNFLAVDGAGPNCYELLIGTVPPAMNGLTLHFQSIAMEPGATALPFPVTNACSSTYGQ